MITLLFATVLSLLLIRPHEQSRRRLEHIQDASRSRRPESRSATRDEPRPNLAPIPSPLLLELLAALLESGAPPSTALHHIGSVLARAGDRRASRLDGLASAIEQGVVRSAVGVPSATPPSRREQARRRHLLRGRRAPRTSDDGDDAGLEVLGDAVRMAASAGLPPAALVRRAAVEERRRTAVTRQRAIRRLEVLLVLPVGLCLLPAFVLLGIVPVIVDLLTG